MAAKTMTADDLRAKTDDQLHEELTELKREQYNLRFQAATNQLEAPSRMREVRRTIARIKTMQTQRRAAAERGEGKHAGAAPAAQKV